VDRTVPRIIVVSVGCGLVQQTAIAHGCLSVCLSVCFRQCQRCYYQHVWMGAWQRLSVHCTGCWSIRRYSAWIERSSVVSFIQVIASMVQCSGMPVSVRSVVVVPFIAHHF